MAVGSKIQTTDYNSAQGLLNSLMGPSAYGTTGWGQTLNSSQVAVNGKITTAQWNALRQDAMAAYIHQNGSFPLVASQPPSAGATFTVSGISLGTAITFTGFISGTTLTLTSVPSGQLRVGMVISGGSGAGAVVTGTYITALTSGSPVLSGSIWTVARSDGSAQTGTGIISMTATPVVMTVTTASWAAGVIQKGQRLTTGAPAANVFITATNADESILTGTGATGTYYVSQTATIASTTTLASTKVIQDADRALYVALANNVSTAGNTVTASNQSGSTTTFAVGTRTTGWNNNLRHTVTITFNAGTGYTAQQAAAWYFNSGSSITIQASQPVAPVGALPKDQSWNSLLSSIGVITLAGNTLSKTGDSGTWTSFTTTAGFWNLTITPTVIAQKTTTSTTYSPNDWKLTASVNNTSARSVITLVIDFEDLTATSLVTPGTGQVDDLVSSSPTYPLTSSVQLYYAAGSYVSVSGYLPTSSAASVAL